DVYLQAREAGVITRSNQLDTARKAEILVRSLAKVRIIALVDEATGYQELRPRDALQAFLDKVISKELAAWAKKFPDEFYENIYKLRG
ncbi:P63C domain-containing protein, partial [Serratia nevei]|uniref:P63C domain-containing protein n=1 Tax=Serratia nevei TaxID=2703794 RepID=UPI00313EDD9D